MTKFIEFCTGEYNEVYTFTSKPINNIITLDITDQFPHYCISVLRIYLLINKQYMDNSYYELKSNNIHNQTIFYTDTFHNGINIIPNNILVLNPCAVFDHIVCNIYDITMNDSITIKYVITQKIFSKFIADRIYIMPIYKNNTANMLIYHDGFVKLWEKKYLDMFDFNTKFLCRQKIITLSTNNDHNNIINIPYYGEGLISCEIELENKYHIKPQHTEIILQLPQVENNIIVGTNSMKLDCEFKNNNNIEIKQLILLSKIGNNLIKIKGDNFVKCVLKYFIILTSYSKFVDYYAYHGTILTTDTFNKMIRRTDDLFYIDKKYDRNYLC